MAELTDSQSKDLNEKMDKIRSTLEADISGMVAYIPTPKRIDLDALLNDVSQLFSPSVFVLLPDLTQFDFSEAGNCIAFERPTAAAFHMLRATEGTLKWYYTQIVRSRRIDNQMWGNIVADLRKKNLTKKHTALNNNLDNIRESYRNPTNHPEATYDIHEVQDLWSLCIEVTNRMVATLKSENRLN